MLSHHALLENITDWQIKGKMAIRKQQEAVSANMNWSVDEPNFSFRLTNFLGVTLVDMEVTPQQAVLEADGERYTRHDASALINEVTGWDLPLKPMLDWVKGLPQKGDIVRFDNNGLLVHLEPACAQCTHWEIDYSDYAKVENVWLPHAITLKNTSQPQDFIKLRISSWTIN